MYKLIPIGTHNLKEFWGLATPFLDMCRANQEKHDALAENTHDNEQLFEHCRVGNGKLFLIAYGMDIIGSFIIEILNTDAGRTFHVTNLGAKGINEWGDNIGPSLIEMAREHNCNDMRIYLVRKGWVKYLKPYGFELIGDKEYGGINYPCLSKNLGEE